MRNNTYKLKIGDIKLSVKLNESSFEEQRNSYTQDTVQQQFFDIHKHSSYEFLAITEGEFILNKIDESFSCKNQIVIVPPYLHHYCDFRDARAIVFNFSIEKAQVQDEMLYDVIKNAINNEIATLCLNDSTRFYINELFTKSKNELSSKAIPHLLSLIFIEIFSDFANVTPNNSSAINNTYVSAIEQYIYNNSNKRITLDDLANEIHICARQVSRIIKQEYGCSLSELLNEKRLNIAKMLLTTTQHTLNEISEMVGYPNEKMFREKFKNQYGVSPNNYRKLKNDSNQ